MLLRNLIGAAAIGLTSLAGGAAAAATIDLGFSLDGSGSVGNRNFNLTRDALATALGSIPTSGDNVYRVAVTQFGTGVQTIVAPTEVTSRAILADLQNTLRGAVRITGGTDTALAITNLRDLFVADGGLGDTTLFNITTDGQPNSQAAALAAADSVIGSGVDGLSFEGISLSLGDESDILALARPFDPDATIVTDIADIPNATTTGFVIRVNTFADYEAAIVAKIGRVVVDTGGGTELPPVPVPAALPLLLTGFAGFAALRRRRGAA